MAMSGMTKFVLLVFSIGCLNGEMKHPDPVLIRTKGKTALIKCDVDSSTLQSTALHWYQAQTGGAFKRLMYFEAASSVPKTDPGVPRRYAGSVSRGKLTLTISTLTLDDAGSYYCAHWSGNDTVLTVEGNHNKNPFSSWWRGFNLERQQQGGDIQSFNYINTRVSVAQEKRKTLNRGLS